MVVAMIKVTRHILLVSMVIVWMRKSGVENVAGITLMVVIDGVVNNMVGIMAAVVVVIIIICK